MLACGAMADQVSTEEASSTELSTLLKGLGEDVGDDVVTEMMNLADTDGDGKVNFEEFVKAASS